MDGAVGERKLMDAGQVLPNLPITAKALDAGESLLELR